MAKVIQHELEKIFYKTHQLFSMDETFVKFYKQGYKYYTILVKCKKGGCPLTLKIRLLLTYVKNQYILLNIRVRNLRFLINTLILVLES